MEQTLIHMCKCILSLRTKHIYLPMLHVSAGQEEAVSTGDTNTDECCHKLDECKNERPIKVRMIGSSAGLMPGPR
jgi:hypothetical protein